MPRMREDGLIVQLDNLVCEHPDFEALHEPTLNGYCFRCVPNGLVERQEEPEVEALLDVLNEEIVQAVQRNGFAAVVTIRIQGRAAIRASFCSDRTLVEEVDATFEAIARWGRLLNKKLAEGISMRAQ
jgi:glutamate/tyrosine decarboxylase-like PLP-dependent enzyme